MAPPSIITNAKKRQDGTGKGTVPAMLEHHRLTGLGWFLPLRLASFIIIFFVVVVWLGYPPFLQFEFVVYASLTLAFAVLLVVDRKFVLRHVTLALVGLQFALEILLESGVIYTTGNTNSSFIALYLPTIVSAALAFRLAGTLLIATLVSLAYTTVIWLSMGNGHLPAPSLELFDTLLGAPDSVFYSTFLHILIYYLTAFVSGFLAERLRDRDRQLADASMALRTARLETDQILRQLNSGLLTIDSEGSIIYFNQAAERILGYREEEVRGMYCQDVFAERMPRLAGYLLETLSVGIRHPRTEIEITGADHRTVPLGLSTSILKDDRSRTRGVIAIFSDLTQVKALEAKVRAADRLAAEGELSASIAHEIRNPLAAISGSVELLKAELDLDGENARLMELIVKESTRLNKTLTDFLSYTRVDRFSRTKVDLCHVVTDVVEILHHHQSYHCGIQVVFETDYAVSYVVGDEDLTKQLLLNLVVNACEAIGSAPGTVLFRLHQRPSDDTVCLEVVDTGPGIPAENQRRLFQPFFSTKKKGTGLGLAICHRICSALGSQITFVSESGVGTTFRVNFPAFSPVSCDETVPRATAHPASI